MQIEIIQNKIFEIRGEKVMLDFDLAALYEVETKVLNQSVKRNIQRFPEDFMFRLTKEEWGYWQLTNIINEHSDNWSQNVTSSKKHRGATYAPYAFTEHGVTMLAGVLRSERAVLVNIAIVRAFIALRQMALNYKEIELKIEQLQDKYDMQFLDIYEMLQKLMTEKKASDSWEERNRIGFLNKR